LALCGDKPETLQHLVTECAYALDIWNRLKNEFNIHSNPKDVLHLWTDCRQKWVW